MRNGRTKDRHHRIADKLLDKPVIASNGFAEHLEQGTLERAHVLRVESLGEGCKSRNVCEEHGDMTPIRAGAQRIFRLERWSFGRTRRQPVRASHGR
jgi:hypothetical protein